MRHPKGFSSTYWAHMRRKEPSFVYLKGLQVLDSHCQTCSKCDLLSTVHMATFLSPFNTEYPRQVLLIQSLLFCSFYCLLLHVVKNKDCSMQLHTSLIYLFFDQGCQGVEYVFHGYVRVKLGLSQGRVGQDSGLVGQVRLGQVRYFSFEEPEGLSQVRILDWRVRLGSDRLGQINQF